MSSKGPRRAEILDKFQISMSSSDQDVSKKVGTFEKQKLSRNCNK